MTDDRELAGLNPFALTLTPRPGAWMRSFPAWAHPAGSGHRGVLGGRYETCSGI